MHYPELSLDELEKQIQHTKDEIQRLKAIEPSTEETSRKILSLITIRHSLTTAYLAKKESLKTSHIRSPGESTEMEGVMQIAALQPDKALTIEKDHVILPEEEELVKCAIDKQSQKVKNGLVSPNEKILLDYLTIKHFEMNCVSTIQLFKSGVIGSDCAQLLELEQNLLTTLREKIEHLANLYPFLEGFKKPTKTNKRKLEPEESTSYGVASKYAILEDEQNETTTEETKITNKIPPIIISDPSLYSEIRKTLQDAGITNYSCTAKPNSLNLKFENIDSYIKIKQCFLQKNYPFHSYNPNPEQKFRVVIKNVPADVPVEDIKEALIAKGYPVISVFQLRKTIDKRKIPLPIFYIELLSQDADPSIYNLKDLLHLIIKVEPYKKKKTPSQCHRCQRYGHTKNNCYNFPRCVKCSGDHLSTKCASKFLDTPKCALCEGEHVASFRGCPKYPTQHINQNIPESDKEIPTSVPTPAPDTEQTQTNVTENDESLKDLFGQLLSWIKDFNLKQIFRILRESLVNMKSAKGPIEKLEVLMQAAELFADLF